MLELRPVESLVGVTLSPLRNKLSNHRRYQRRGVDAGRAAGQEQQLSLVAAAMRAAARPEE